MAAKRAAGRTPCNPWGMHFPLSVGRMWDGTMFSSVCACLRFKRYLAVSPARLEARMDSLLSFPVGLFHPLQHAGLSRRSPTIRELSRAIARIETPTAATSTDSGLPSTDRYYFQ